MSCPNCKHSLKELFKDNQTILHCTTCGGSFFEQNGINRISVSTARELAHTKKSNVIMGTEHHCPRDNAILSSIHNEEAIPMEVTLLKCPTCFGVFAYPDDLLHFKRAQDVKIKFFKIWGKPMPSIQQVLVMSMLGFVALMMVLQVVSLRSPQLTTTSADEIIKNVQVQKSGTFYAVYFVTPKAYRSFIRLTDATGEQLLIKDIASQPNTVHVVTLPNLGVGQEVFYQITVLDETGQTVQSAVQKLK